VKLLIEIFQIALVLAFVTFALLEKFDYSNFFGIIYCITLLAEIKYSDRRRKKIKLKDGTYGYGRADDEW